MRDSAGGSGASTVTEEGIAATLTNLIEDVGEGAAPAGVTLAAPSGVRLTAAAGVSLATQSTRAPDAILSAPPPPTRQEAPRLVSAGRRQTQSVLGHLTVDLDAGSPRALAEERLVVEG